MSDWAEHLARHAELVERYGKAEMVDLSALRLVGKRGEVHPDDVGAFVHRTRESFDAMRRATGRTAATRPTALSRSSAASSA